MKNNFDYITKVKLKNDHNLGQVDFVPSGCEGYIIGIHRNGIVRVKFENDIVDCDIDCLELIKPAPWIK